MPEIPPFQKYCQTSGFTPTRLPQIKVHLILCPQESLIHQFANAQGHLSLLCGNEFTIYTEKTVRQRRFEKQKCLIVSSVFGLALFTIYSQTTIHRKSGLE